jgi:hypothetical protein
MKYVLIPIDFKFSFCDISHVVLLHSCSSFALCCVENRSSQECSIRRPVNMEVYSLRTLQFSFGSLNSSTVFVC